MKKIAKTAKKLLINSLLNCIEIIPIIEIFRRPVMDGSAGTYYMHLFKYIKCTSYILDKSVSSITIN